MLAPEDEYRQVEHSFQHGELAQSENAAAALVERYRNSQPRWSARFRVLEAQSAAWRGMSPEVVRLLTFSPTDADLQIRALSLLAAAHVHLHAFGDAREYLARADQLCSAAEQPVCTHVVNAHWTLAIEEGDYEKAYSLALKNLSLARVFRDPFEQAAALMNLANTCLYQQHYDEAIDWLNASNDIAGSLDAQDILLTNTGNLGWAYYSLGDHERAFALFLDAERRAAALGDAQGTILWLTTTGYVLQDSGEWARARESYQHALQLAKRINSSEDIINSLESLTHISIELGEVDAADQYLHQLDPLLSASANRLDVLDVTLARGRIAAARHQDQQAEALFRQVEADPASQITMRLGAEHQLARLFESDGHSGEALKMYAAALATFESARDRIKSEDSKLPYFANATPIYDDYIRLLISNGKVDQALAAADQSRARTLEQGLGLNPARPALHDAAFHPGAIAARAGATLLFYWLGERQSWLWTVTPGKTTVYQLSPKAVIARQVASYRQALQGPDDPVISANQDGVALYRTLIAPARAWLPPGRNVDILCDGVLSELNFETLIVPQPSPHYWIDDANIVSAPSLLLLASSRPMKKGDRHNLLLIGNAISPGRDYPQLPNAELEMREIRRHFSPHDEAIFEGRRATPASYIQSTPQQFAYIDFVAHGVASQTDPLDSAIILSRMPGTEDSFRLNARDIMQHRIDARLVTISACYGGGTRAYAGEGLVGLSWAFLYAGAHNVIGTLWEVSDASAPLLMDAVYGDIEQGLAPRIALRRAKLRLLQGSFRRPFFWGPFELFTGA
jgi:CHAT domain-containing protein